MTLITANDPKHYYNIYCLLRKWPTEHFETLPLKNAWVKAFESSGGLIDIDDPFSKNGYPKKPGIEKPRKIINPCIQKVKQTKPELFSA